MPINVQPTSSKTVSKFDTALCWTAKDDFAVDTLVSTAESLLSELDEKLSGDARERLGKLGRRQNGLICIGPGDYVAGLVLLKASQKCAITIVNDRAQLITDRRSMKVEFVTYGVKPEEFDHVAEMFGLTPKLSEAAKKVASQFF